MLILLHIPTATPIKFPIDASKDTIDLEFQYKRLFYSGKINCSFALFLERTKAELITKSMPLKDRFYKLNPSLKTDSIFMSEFEVSFIDETTSSLYPVIELDMSEIKPAKSYGKS